MAGWTEAVWNTKFVRHFFKCPLLGIKPQPFWPWVQCFIRLATCCCFTLSCPDLSLTLVLHIDVFAVGYLMTEILFSQNVCTENSYQDIADKEQVALLDIGLIQSQFCGVSFGLLYMSNSFISCGDFKLTTLYSSKLTTMSRSGCSFTD